MSTDISLLLEHYDSGQWRPAFHVADRLTDPHTHLGIVSVCWWSVRSRPTSLFFGDNAVIPFRPGLPLDVSQNVAKYALPNFERDSKFAGWLPLPELELARWHDRSVIVGGPVEAQYAHLFGDGNQPAPITQLEQMGIADPVLERITNWNNHRRNEVAIVNLEHVQQLQPDCKVVVTWREPLDEFVGYIWAEGLSRLVGLDSPHRYRIVTSIG